MRGEERVLGEVIYMMNRFRQSLIQTERDINREPFIGPKTL